MFAFRVGADVNRFQQLTSHLLTYVELVRRLTTTRPLLAAIHFLFVGISALTLIHLIGWPDQAFPGLRYVSMVVAVVAFLGTATLYQQYLTAILTISMITLTSLTTLVFGMGWEDAIKWTVIHVATLLLPISSSNWWVWCEVNRPLDQKVLQKLTKRHERKGTMG